MTAVSSEGIALNNDPSIATKPPPEAARDYITTDTAVMYTFSEEGGRKPPPAPSGNRKAPSPGLSKRDAIRKRLREKEEKLNQMMGKRPMKATEDLLGSASSVDGSLVKGGTTQFRIIRTEGKDEADRREAIRVLSQAALQMKDKLKAQKDKSVVLKSDLNSLVLSLKEKEDQKALLEDELRRVRNESKANERDLLEMKKALDEKSALLRQFEGDDVAVKEKDLQNQLMAAYEEVVWTQKDSMSKAEQIEYFEYQLLARNHEIDDMKQELNTKLRRIVELEIDLEIHDDRFQTSMDEYSKAGSANGTLSSTSDIQSVRKERIIDSTPSLLEAKHRRGSLDGWRSIFRRKNKNRAAGRSASSAVGNNNGNTDMVGMDRVYKDLMSLEERYKKDKYHSRMQIEQLKQENNEYLIKVLLLEKSLQTKQALDDSDHYRDTAESKEQRISDAVLVNTQLDSLQPSDSLNSSNDTEQEHLPTRTHFLEEKIQTLQNTKGVQALTIERLRAQIIKMEQEEKKRATRDEQVADRVRMEGETSELKIAALERELRELSESQTLDHSFKALHVNAAAGLEAKLQDNMSEVIRLRKEQEIKDKKIESLRSEIIELRLVRMQFEKAAQQGTEDSRTKLESIREDVGVANGVVMGTEAPTQVDKIAPIPNEAAGGIYTNSKY